MDMNKAEQEREAAEREEASLLPPPPPEPQGIPLEQGFEMFGGMYTPPSWLRVGSLCVLSGFARALDPDQHKLIGRLPTVCRPGSGRRVFHTVGFNEENIRVDVRAASVCACAGVD